MALGPDSKLNTDPYARPPRLIRQEDRAIFACIGRQAYTLFLAPLAGEGLFPVVGAPVTTVDIDDVLMGSAWHDYDEWLAWQDGVKSRSEAATAAEESIPFAVLPRSIR